MRNLRQRVTSHQTDVDEKQSNTDGGVSKRYMFNTRCGHCLGSDLLLVTNYGEGGGLQNGRGGPREVLPLRKGGTEKVLAMLKGDTKSLGVVFMQYLEVLAIL